MAAIRCSDRIQPCRDDLEVDAPVALVRIAFPDALEQIGPIVHTGRLREPVERGIRIVARQHLVDEAAALAEHDVAHAHAMRADHQASGAECRDLLGHRQRAGHHDPHALPLQQGDQLRFVLRHALWRVGARDIDLLGGTAHPRHRLAQATKRRHRRSDDHVRRALAQVVAELGTRQQEGVR